MVLNMNTLSANLKPSFLNYFSNFKVMLGITIKRMKGMFLLIIALNVDRVEKISSKNARAHCRGRETKETEMEEERRERVLTLHAQGLTRHTTVAITYQFFCTFPFIFSGIGPFLSFLSV